MDMNMNVIRQLNENHKTCNSKSEKRIIKRLINILRHCSVIRDGKLQQTETLDDLFSVRINEYLNLRGLGRVTHNYLQDHLLDTAKIQLPDLQVLSEYKPQTATFYEYFLEQGINTHAIKEASDPQDGYYRSARFATEAECALYLNKNHIERSQIISISVEANRSVWMLFEACE